MRGGITLNFPGTIPALVPLPKIPQWLSSSTVGKFGMKPDRDHHSSGKWEYLPALELEIVLGSAGMGKSHLEDLGDSTFQDLESCLASRGCTDRVFPFCGNFLAAEYRSSAWESWRNSHRECGRWHPRLNRRSRWVSRRRSGRGNWGLVPPHAKPQKIREF